MMNRKYKQEMMAKAVDVARRIVAGEVDPNEGCDEIGRICEELEWPDELIRLGQLAHEQHGHENLGMTAETCVPDIFEESKKLIETISKK